MLLKVKCINIYIYLMTFKKNYDTKKKNKILLEMEVVTQSVYLHLMSAS